MLVPGVIVPEEMWYGEDLADLIGGNISPDVLGWSERVQLSVLLTMISTTEIAALLGTTPEYAIELFDLGQVEVVIGTGGS